jgi:hypothetical protein
MFFRLYAVLAIVFWSSAALAAGHGSIPSVPSFAVSGISANHLAFYERFNSTANIDVAQTTPAGKNWYINNQAKFTGLGGCPTTNPTPSWYTVSNGYLTVSSNSASCQGAETMSFGWVNATTTVQNFTIPGSNGFYIEGQFKFTPNCSQTFIPDFWLQDIQGITAQMNGSGSFSFGEVDVFEGCNSSNSQTAQTVDYWTCYNCGPTFQRSNADLSGVDYTKPHLWGAMVTTIAQGGGTGSACWYVDRVPTGSCVPWTNNTSGFGLIEKANFEINHAAGNGIPLSVGYIAVWVP